MRCFDLTEVLINWDKKLIEMSWSGMLHLFQNLFPDILNEPINSFYPPDTALVLISNKFPFPSPSLQTSPPLQSPDLHLAVHTSSVTAVPPPWSINKYILQIDKDLCEVEMSHQRMFYIYMCLESTRKPLCCSFIRAIPSFYYHFPDLFSKKWSKWVLNIWTIFVRLPLLHIFLW